MFSMFFLVYSCFLCFVSVFVFSVPFECVRVFSVSSVCSYFLCLLNGFSVFIWLFVCFCLHVLRIKMCWSSSCFG